MNSTASLPLAVSLPPWFLSNWPAIAVAGLALFVLLIAAWQRRRHSGAAWWLAIAAAGLLLFAAGGIAFPGKYALPVLLVVAGGLGLLLAVLLMMGGWSRHVALLLLAAGLLSLGALALQDVAEDLEDLVSSLAAMRLKSPWWLCLLAVIPVIVLLSRRRLNREEIRPWMALGLRVLGVALLALR
jgi:hypothetical protein